MIRLEGVSKYYNSDANVVLGLRRINLELHLGEFVAITGESGSGKSTLANVISGLDKYDEGEIYLNNEETSYFSIEEQEQYRKQYIGFVFQNYNIIDSFTVYENVMAALMIQGYDPKRRSKRALELIEKVGLTSHKNQHASKLSGGQKQRAVIARALAKDAPIIVADEPTGNLDSKTGDMIMALLKEVSKDKLVIVVTHNYEQVAPYATRKIRMFDGEIAEDKTIKPFDKAEIIAPESKNLAMIDVIKMAFLSIFRMPKKTILLLLTVLIGILGMQSIYAFDKFLPDLLFGEFQDYNQLFPNNVEERLIFIKNDRSVFTQTELDDLLNEDHVLDVIHYDHLLDMDFFLTDENMAFQFGGYAVPTGIVDDTVLSSGTLPNVNQIAMKQPYYIDQSLEIGDTIRLVYKNRYIDPSIGLDDNSYIDVEISGFIKDEINDYAMILDTDLFNQSVNNQISNNHMMAYLTMNHLINFGYQSDRYDINMRAQNIIIDETLSDDQIEVSASLLNYLESLAGSGSLIGQPINMIKIEGSFSEEKSDTFTITDSFEDYDFSIKMNANSALSFIQEGPYQVSILAEDAFYAKNIMNQYQNDYTIIYPAAYQGSPFVIGGLGFLTFLAYALIGSFSYVIVNLVVKSVIESRRKDFVILRSIGASKRDLKGMLLIEQIIYASLAYGITYLILNIMDMTIPNFIILRYLGLEYHIFSYLLILFILLYMARKFSIRLFGRSVITTLKQE